MHSQYKPTGDQPQAIDQLCKGLMQGTEAQTLLGVTGSGKTFTMANVIERINRPTLVLSHNKTLAAQLYSEFKAFFPENSVHYFVSYYDYYQPEAYIPQLDKYIEKDLAINSEIDRMRLAATSALLSGRRDIIVVSSVSCIYGMGNPEDFEQNILYVKVGDVIDRNEFLRSLVSIHYRRTEQTMERGTFRVKGDTLDIRLAHEEIMLRIIFWGDEIESLQNIDMTTGCEEESYPEYRIYPANIFCFTREQTSNAMSQISNDLEMRVEQFRMEGRMTEADRLSERVNQDLEMIREVGYCSGIENYSRYFDGRQPGERPFCLLDYFPRDFVTFIDESHVTLPQIRGMHGGDKARKLNLVHYGFRLPAAIDNRPLTFDEFEGMTDQTIYVSATPSEYELNRSEGVIVEQIIRPTGLLDPTIEVRPIGNQVDDVIEEIQQRIERDERTLVVALTKRMAEEMSDYLMKVGINASYVHSDVDTMERIKIIEDLRNGVIDVLIGVNLLREGLDIPEVSLVAIFDADKEGFLRTTRSLTQTVGRAARNLHGTVIMYADKITDSMRQTIDETSRRRSIQMAYNTSHGITPRGISKSHDSAITRANSLEQQILSSAEPEKPVSLSHRAYDLTSYDEKGTSAKAEPKAKAKAKSTAKGVKGRKLVPKQTMSAEEKSQEIERLKKEMILAARNMEFTRAAALRDRIINLTKQ